MEEIKIGIIGYGHVGKTVDRLIPRNRQYSVYIYDINNCGTEAKINECDFAFICVPTPLDETTGLLDVTEVDRVLSWCKVPYICIKSTVPVGYTETANEKYDSHIIFSPEYYGETVKHPYAENGGDWLTLGGKEEDVKVFADMMQGWYPSTAKIHCVDARTAEVAKFMTNSFFATKVTYCNTFYDIAQKFGVDYHKLRETWLLDPRVGESHTMVYPDNRGYGGKCLPKDIQSITTQAQEKGVDIGLLQGVIDTNYRTKLPFN